MDLQGQPTIEASWETTWHFIDTIGTDTEHFLQWIQDNGLYSDVIVQKVAMVTYHPKRP